MKFREVKDEYDGALEQIRVMKISEVQYKNSIGRLEAHIK